MRLIYLYLIPMRIYEIIISKINVILSKHYYRFEMIQNTFFQTHVDSAVSANMFKSSKRIFRCQCFMAALPLVSSKVNSSTREMGSCSTWPALPSFILEHAESQTDPAEKDLMPSGVSFYSVMLWLLVAPRGSWAER